MHRQSKKLRSVKKKIVVAKRPAQKVDLTVDQLWNGNAGWIGKVAGSMSEYPEFLEVLKLGREARRRMNRLR